MALIRCIECDASISEYANCCPQCGCPKELQSTNAKPMEDRSITNLPIANYNLWIEAFKLAKDGKQTLYCKAYENITGNKNFHDQYLLWKEMESCDEIPCEAITRLIKNENGPAITTTSDKPSTLEEWRIAYSLLIEDGNVYRALKRVQNLICSSQDNATYICKRMIDTKEIPFNLIKVLFPEAGARMYEVSPTTTCTACSRPISVKAETCPHCGNPTGVHTCPRCGSTDWVYIDAASKVGAMALFGAFAVNTVRNKYQCRACKFKY